MTKIRGEPCAACPYRREVPPGLWHPDEYRKLMEYEGETWEQRTAAFHCHATPEFLCHGWAVVGGYDLLGLRLDAIRAKEVIEIPPARFALFRTHREAAEHGFKRQTAATRRAVKHLLKKYPRLRHD